VWGRPSAPFALAGCKAPYKVCAMLLQIPAVLTKDQVDHIRAMLKDSDWVDGKVTAGPQSAPAKKNLQVPETAPSARALGKIITEALGKNELFHSAALPAKVVPPLFNRYEQGMTYGTHVDNALRIQHDGGRSRTDMSCTVFLTDPADYDGGELVVEDTYGWHAVKLAAGDAILYSSSSQHRVNPVTRGTRWSSFFWVQSMVREEAARGMLFDLDRSVQSLRKSVGDSPEVLRLTALYHNLFRRWADV
jgi:PKHD-type hydroxylase